jgi:hypothetical protein
MPLIVAGPPRRHGTTGLCFVVAHSSHLEYAALLVIASESPGLPQASIYGHLHLANHFLQLAAPVWPVIIGRTRCSGILPRRPHSHTVFGATPNSLAACLTRRCSPSNGISPLVARNRFRNAQLCRNLPEVHELQKVSGNPFPHRSRCMQARRLAGLPDADGLPERILIVLAPLAAVVVEGYFWGVAD